MRGLLLIGVAILWFWFVFFISRWVIKKTKTPWIRRVTAPVIFLLLLVAPLGDEIVGKYQFEKLCKKYSVQHIDTEHAMNRRVIYVLRGTDQYAKGTAVKIRIDPVVYRDAETNQIIVSYHTLHATGGWFIRALGISETNAPLLFTSGCAPENQDDFKAKFNITVIN